MLFIVPVAALKLKADLSHWVIGAAASVGRGAGGRGEVVRVRRRLTGSGMIAIV